MTFRKSILLVVAVATISALVACSSSAPPITLSLNSIPTSIPFNTQIAVVASVDNDKANGGVVWSCTTTPTGPSCGSFSPATTNSGASSDYTAPYTLLPTGTTITITATSATNSAVSQSSAPITIGAPTLASGNYVFSAQGEDTNGLYYLAGAITVLNGKITAGEQDSVDFQFEDYDLINPTGSSFSTTADGNLQVTLVACVPVQTANGAVCGANDTNVGVAGIETLNGSVAALNPNKFLITEFDASATSSGVLALQNATPAAAQPSGGYAFDVHGIDSSGSFVTIGGVINVDDLPGTSGGPATKGSISGAGSAFDANNEGDVYTYPTAETFSPPTFVLPAVACATFTPGCVSAPDSFGRVVFSLKPTDSAHFSSIALAGYIVDFTSIQLVETGDGYGGTTGGTALVQGSNTGKFGGANTSVAGNAYVVGLSGEDECFYLQSAGQLSFASAEGVNSVTGFINYNDLSCLAADPTTPSAITAGTWTEDATGRVTVSGVTDDNVTFNVQLYRDGNGNLMALTMDPSDVLGGRGFAQSGAASIGASSFANAYGFGVSGYDPNNGFEFDAAGGVVADGSGTFTGTADVNWYLSSAGVGGSATNLPTYVAAPVTGSFTAASGAPFTGILDGVDLLTCPIFNPSVEGAVCNDDTFAYYMIDAAGENIAIETDVNQLSLGYFDQE